MTLRDSKSNFSAKGLIHFPTAKKYMYMYMCIHVQWHCITLYKYVLHVHVPVYGERSYSMMYIHVVVVVHSQQYEACMCKCCPGYFTKDTYELYAVIQNWLLAHFIHVCCLHLLEVPKQQTCMKCSYCARNHSMSWNFQCSARTAYYIRTCTWYLQMHTGIV